MVKRNCCLGCISQQKTFELGQAESEKRSFSQMPEDDAAALRYIFRKYHSTEGDVIKYNTRTVKQVQTFPWNECHTQFENCNRIPNVHVFLANNDKYIDSGRTRKFLEQKCPNIALQMVDGIHEYPIIDSETAMGQIEDIFKGTLRRQSE